MQFFKINAGRRKEFFFQKILIHTIKPLMQDKSGNSNIIEKSYIRIVAIRNMNRNNF